MVWGGVGVWGELESNGLEVEEIARSVRTCKNVGFDYEMQLIFQLQILLLRHRQGGAGEEPPSEASL